MFLLSDLFFCGVHAKTAGFFNHSSAKILVKGSDMIYNIFREEERNLTRIHDVLKLLQTLHLFRPIRPLLRIVHTVIDWNLPHSLVLLHLSWWFYKTWTLVTSAGSHCSSTHIQSEKRIADNTCLGVLKDIWTLNGYKMHVHAGSKGIMQETLINLEWVSAGNPCSTVYFGVYLYDCI